MSLKWTTVASSEKIATTHFGVVYRVRKAGMAGNWFAYVTHPTFRGKGGGTDRLDMGLTYAQAVKVCNSDYIKNGGR